MQITLIEFFMLPTSSFYSISRDKLHNIFSPDVRNQSSFSNLSKGKITSFMCGNFWLFPVTHFEYNHSFIKIFSLTPKVSRKRTCG